MTQIRVVATKNQKPSTGSDARAYHDSEILLNLRNAINHPIVTDEASRERVQCDCNNRRKTRQQDKKKFN